MPPDCKDLLEDKIDAAVHIRGVTSSMDREGFFQDYKATAAVERCFIIIGEALRRLRDHHSEVAEKIPDLAHIIDFRNILVHNYDSLSKEIIWSSIKNDLPELYTSVCELKLESSRPKI